MKTLAFSILLLLSACSFTPVNSSKLNRLQNPSQTTAFTQNWPFDATTTASYSYNSSTMDFTGGVCRLTASNQTDNSSACTGFGDGVTPSCGGSFAGAAWDSTNGYVRLDAATADAELSSTWTPSYASIIGYWKLNGTTGTNITDGTTVNAVVGPNGTFKNANASTYPTTGYLVAKQNQGIAFDAVDDYIDLGFHSVTSTALTSFAVQAWVRFTSASTRAIMSEFKSANCSNMIFQVSLGKIQYSDGVAAPLSTTQTVNDGNWHHVVYTTNGTTAYIYIDGAQSISGAAQSWRNFCTNTRKVLIGAQESGGYFFGAMDEIAVWSTYLSPTDVKTIYERQGARYTGTFTSRVMDALAAGQSWTKFSWTSTLPFFKALPDYSGGTIQNETSTDYSSLVGMTGSVGDNNLMNGIVGLWHLDEASYSGAANEIVDSSGQNHHGSAIGGASTSNGLMSLAANLTAAAQGLSFGAIFATAPNAYTDCGWYLIRSYGTNGTSLIYAGDTAYNRNLTLVIRNDGSFQFGHTPSLYNTAASLFSLGKWQHICHTWNGTIDRLYLQGVQIATNTPGTIPSATPQVMMLGKMYPDTNWTLNGLMDEVAFWNRALTPAEIFQLYRRGANRVKFQVRICTTPNAGYTDCTDDPTGTKWKGPDGTNQTYFSELNNMSVQAAVSSGNVLPTAPSMNLPSFASPPGASQYFQYRAILESDDTSTNCNYGGATWCSPELKSVKVDPVHYDNSSPTVVGKAGVSFKSLSNFVQTVGASCAGGIGYNLGVGASSAGATWYWWNGATWVVANGTAAQSNTAAVVATNAPSFAGVAGTGTVYFKAYLKSDGTQACELDNVELDGMQ